jgi:hypothetical protein
LEIRRILAEKIGVVSQDTLYSPRTSLRYCLPSRLVAGFPFAVHPASKNELRKRPTMEFTVSRACEGVRDGGGGHILRDVQSAVWTMALPETSEAMKKSTTTYG